MFFKSSNLGKSIAITISAVVLLALLLACVSVPFEQPSIAVSKAGNYYSQLDDNAQKFYDALENMYTKGNLKTGTTEFDLIDKNVVTSEQARKYAEGDESILRSFATAKDVFLMENNVFYVDFSKLQLSIGIKDNKYVVTMGAGRNSNYYSAGFENESQVESALNDYKTALNEIVTTAEKKETTEQKVRAANSLILQKATFGYGITSDGKISDTASYITTNYGALCKETAVYEGFARLFKDVLDSLNIENVLVNGYVLNSNESFVPAMWNYVKIGSKWYAVDVGLNSQNAENPQEFVLVGQNQMKYRHYISKTIASSSREFSCPELSEEYYGFEEDVAVSCSFAEASTVLSASYMGRNSTALAKDKDLYLAFRTSTNEFDSNSISWGSWIAMSVACANENGNYKNQISETDSETALTVPQTATYVQVAVINVKPTSDAGVYGDVDKGNIVSISEIIANKNHTEYVSAPTAKKVLPSGVNVLDVDRSYTIVIQYDESLAKANATEPFAVSVTSSRGAKAESVTNVVWNSEQDADTITFTFKASAKFNDNYQTYYFEIENLVGSKSKKAPNKVAMNFQKFNINLSSVTKTAGGYNYLAMSENNSIDLTDWQFASETGESISASNKLANQLSFASSTLSTDFTQSIIKKICDNKSIVSSDILANWGYDTELCLCGGKVTFMNGKMLKLKAPITTNDTSYRVFVCSKDENGELQLDNITEAKCFIDSNELTIETNKFGALVLLAVNKSSISNGERVLLVKNINGNGGIKSKINGVEQTDIIALKLDESVIFELSSNPGYKVANCLLNGKALSSADDKIIISYNDLRANNILDICFVSTRVTNYETTIGLQNLQSEFLANQFVPSGTNLGLWISIIVLALAILTLVIVWIVVVVKNKKREKIAREFGI